NAWQVDPAVAKMSPLRLEIVKRSDDAKGFVVLPRHWVVECTFSWFGRNRRLAKDFENLAQTRPSHLVNAGQINMGSMIMKALRVITSGGGEAILDEAAVSEFAASLRGRVLLAGDGDYDEARKLFNGMIDHRPAVIARCTGAADVVAAVRFAREHDL